jgi:hypothetical protein
MLYAKLHKHINCFKVVKRIYFSPLHLISLTFLTMNICIWKGNYKTGPCGIIVWKWIVEKNQPSLFVFYRYFYSILNYVLNKLDILDIGNKNIVSYRMHTGNTQPYYAPQKSIYIFGFYSLVHKNTSNEIWYDPRKNDTSS